MKSLLWFGSGSPRRARSVVPSLVAAGCALAALGSGPAESPQSIVKPFTPSAPAVYTYGIHDVGLLTLRLTSFGLFGDPLHPNISAEWHGYEHLYSAALWAGAIGADGGKHVSAGESYEFRPELSPIWTIYESREGQKGAKRVEPAWGTDTADDDGDGFVDEDFQNGLDDDGDGRIDEDYAAIGQQMLSVMYRDDTDEAIAQLPNHHPLGLLVRQRSFQWSTAGINEMVGFQWEIINDGEQVLTDLYFGCSVDPDIGSPDDPNYYNNDLIAVGRVDTTVVIPGGGFCSSVDLDVPAVWAWDSADNGGATVGVFGAVLLGHTTSAGGILAPSRVDWRTAKWFNALAGYDTNDTTRYDLLASGEVSPGAATIPADYRAVISVGPFSQLNPGESRTVEGAFVVGGGFGGFRRNAAAAQMVYNGEYVDLDQDPLTGIDGKERCIQVLEPGGQVIWTDPCDTAAVPVIWRSTDCLWVDDDCNSCTGIDGKETRIGWLGSLAPPFPGTNLDPALFYGSPPPSAVHPGQDGRAVVQWDNGSELEPDPITGTDIFEGYRLWKAPSGVPPILPGHDDWTLLGTYRMNPEPGDESVDLSLITNPVSPLGINDLGRPIYPVGRYEVADSNVVNGLVYFYSVVPFGFRTEIDPNTQNPVQVEVSGIPVTKVEYAVVPCDTCGIVPVKLTAFATTRTGDGVLITWSVASANDAAGFHVYRQDPQAERVRITDRLLTGGPDYAFTDRGSPPGGAMYWLQALDRTGGTSWLGPFALGTEIPRLFTVGRPAPNPFSGETQLRFTLPAATPVRAAVYNLQGQRIRSLLDRETGPGTHVLTWTGETDAGSLAPPGLYVISVQAAEQRVSRKVLALR